ncbi:MAG: cytochrome c oxidase accessory protein CcoG [Bacteroidota bacterium]
MVDKTSEYIDDPFLTELESDAFRDSIATVDKSGKRQWIYPKKPQGSLYKGRTWLSVLLIGLFFIGPFLKWNGQPLLLFNLLERKFIVFGLTFWPQDFHLFVLAMITFFVFIVLFTVIFGRVWCGWACPQTIFMEMFFRKIEYWIEGDYRQQIKLNQAPWNLEKVMKKTAKFSIFALFSFLIGNTVMAYLVGIDQLSVLITSPPAENWGLFTFVMIFSGIFYFVFSWFREQACIAVCPYGRLQGVLLGKDSIVVAYDWLRGEPRGKRKRNEDPGTKGDCIDCKLCIAVCPTGIDIRNGTQMECVNCTACIDACDQVMEKVKKPKGLIRFDSYNGIANGIPFRFNTRIIAYSVVLVALLSVLGFSLSSRSDIETTLLRVPGTLYQKTEDGQISNMYNIDLVNKTKEELNLDIKLTSHEGEIQVIGQEFVVAPQDISQGIILIKIPRDLLEGRKNEIKIELWSGDQLVDKASSNFLGPVTLK